MSEKTIIVFDGRGVISIVGEAPVDSLHAMADPDRFWMYAPTATGDWLWSHRVAGAMTADPTPEPCPPMPNTYNPGLLEVTGLPAGAMVSVAPPEEIPDDMDCSPIAVPSGSIAFDPLAPGTYLVRIRAPLYLPLDLEVIVP